MVSEGGTPLNTIIRHVWPIYFLSLSFAAADDLPDIRTVTVDLRIPALSEDSPAAGRRVRQTHPNWKDSKVYHVLYLPENWRADETASYPVLVEWAGNGGYSNAFGDDSTGRPEGSHLGYGLSAGRDFIWLCLPYLNNAGNDIALTWWGDAPNHDPEPTLRYCRATVESVCRDFRGDPNRVVLCGFSRGAIACNYLGLHDDEISKLWCGFLAYSHYDGVRSWPFPGSDRESARVRLNRLGKRPQFICSEGNGAEVTRQYLAPLGPQDRLTFMSTGFRNHNDAWVLRPGEARQAARRWLNKIVVDHPPVR